MEACSFLLRRGELLVAVLAMNDELVLACVLHHASRDELLHHLGGQLPGLVRLLELHDLLLERLDLDVLLRLILLLLELGLLVGPDLRHGAAPLAGCLQHVGRDALRN